MGKNIHNRPINIIKKPNKTLIGNNSCNINKEDKSVIAGAKDTIRDIIFTFALLSRA